MKPILLWPALALALTVGSASVDAKPPFVTSRAYCMCQCSNASATTDLTWARGEFVRTKAVTRWVVLAKYQVASASRYQAAMPGHSSSPVHRNKLQFSAVDRLPAQGVPLDFRPVPAAGDWR